MKICSVSGCDRRVDCHGMCPAHVGRMKRGAPLDAPIRKPSPGPCSIDGCGRKAIAHKLCTMHYQRAKKGQDMFAPPKQKAEGLTCCVDGCDKKCVAKGMCYTHYERTQDGRDVNAPVKKIAKPFESTGCSVEGCDRPFMSRNLCQFHYGREWAGIPLDQERAAERGAQTSCGVDGCTEDFFASNMCKRHYAIEWRKEIQSISVEPGSDGACAAPGCDKLATSRDWCSRHYQSEWRVPLGPRCGVEGCDRPRSANGLCEPHRMREVNGLPIEIPIGKRNTEPVAVVGGVYFIRGGDLIKIGVSKNVAHRLKQLQTASPVQLTLIAVAPGGAETEGLLHDMFSAIRSHGEWFRMEPELNQFIATVIKTYPQPDLPKEHELSWRRIRKLSLVSSNDTSQKTGT